MTTNKPSSRSTRSSLRVAAVQMKFVPTIQGNLSSIERLAGEAKRRRADAVLFPECAVTGYAFDFTRLERSTARATLHKVGKIAAKLHVNILVGAPVYSRRNLHNCLVAFDRRGRIAHCYAKCQLTEGDQQFFVPGNAIALFRIDGVLATTVICHERRYPELARLAVMAGAKILFHPNAGMDALSVSRKKRGGNDGITARAFENAVFYVFANSVGPQGGGKWSAGDSKIVAPDQRVLKLADNRDEAVLVADLDLTLATRRYAVRGMQHPRFLASTWRQMVRAVRAQAAQATGTFDL